MELERGYRTWGGRGTSARSLLAALVLVLAACNSDTSGGVGNDKTSPSPAPSVVSPLPAAGATPSLVATPTPTVPKDVEIENFGVSDGWLSVVLKNTNEDFGLARARFSIAAIGTDGTVLGIVGDVGVPGSLSSTIYELPPGGEFYFSDSLGNGSPAVDHLEFSLVDNWSAWDTADPAEPTLSGLAVSTDYGFATLRGRVLNPGDQTINVYVGAQATEGGKLVVITGVVECLRAGENRAFELQGLVPVSAKLTVGRAVAYPTTVRGIGSVQSAPGC